MSVKSLLSKQFVFLDGGMGTMLQKHGLQAGEHPEVFNLSHPETVGAIHRAYLEAGSNMIYSNTFGANARKLASTGLTPQQVIPAALQIALQEAAPFEACVALDIGPIGELMAPAGSMHFEEAYALFQEQVLLGAAAGADLIVIETMTDLAEMRAAVLAAKENCSLPVFASMSFEADGRSFTGCPIEVMAEVLSGLGVDALGVNCSLGPKQILCVIQKIKTRTIKPLLVKANAGLPDAATGRYPLTADAFAEEMAACAEAGIQFVGGCCGTTPEYIRALKAALEDQKRARRGFDASSRVCSATQLLTIDRPCIIGERINPTGKKALQQALLSGDWNQVLSLGVQQADAGAQILDVNVGLPGLDEPSVMHQVVEALQDVTELPLQIDSTDPAAIEAALRCYAGKAIVNSVNGEEAVLQRILPLVKRYGAAVIGLTTDENGIPTTAAARVEIARRILDAARACGIPDRNVFIDCLTLTVSAQPDAVRETLEAVRTIREELGLHVVLGISNISFGLPNRTLLNQSFLVQALGAGTDLPIINPCNAAMMDAFRAYLALNGCDPDCSAYVARYTVSSPAPAAVSSSRYSLSEAIQRGLKAEVQPLTEALLSERSEMQIIDELLIPALDEIGLQYERGEVFLPQLLRAAEAACEAFQLLQERLQSSGRQINKGKILLATVQGDIHDIGKNIVGTLLSNYGYQVIDLGRDVPPERIVDAAIQQQIPLIGLSALMTTTLGSMKKTIQALRASGHACRIMVGGAVLTPEYAAAIGADFYAKDAKQSVEIARTVFQET